MVKPVGGKGGERIKGDSKFSTWATSFVIVLLNERMIRGEVGVEIPSQRVIQGNRSTRS